MTGNVWTDSHVSRARPRRSCGTSRSTRRARTSSANTAAPSTERRSPTFRRASQRSLRSCDSSPKLATVNARGLTGQRSRRNEFEAIAFNKLDRQACFTLFCVWCSRPLTNEVCQTAAERRVYADMQREIKAARIRILEQTLRAAAKVNPGGYISTLQRRFERAWSDSATY